MTTQQSDNLELTAIIDAVADADVATDTEKTELLRRIDAEQGIVSDGLHGDIVGLFRKQAAYEQEKMQDGAALLGARQDPVRAHPEDAQEAEGILLETERALRSEDQGVLSIVDKVREDVRRMDREASTGAENVRKAADQDEMERIRRGLASGPNIAA